MSDLQWDGSFLGKLDKKAAILVEKIEDFNILEISISNKKVKCSCREIRDDIPLIINALKEVFLLDVNVVHTFRWCGNRYMAYRPGSIHPFRLSRLETGVSLDLRKKIRDFFLFREILGVSSSHSGCLRTDGISNVQSFLEVSLCEKPDSHVLPDTIISEWFEGNSIDSELNRFITEIYPKNVNISEILFDFRKQMNQIISDINPDMIWITHRVIQRIISRIDSTISTPVAIKQQKEHRIGLIGDRMSGKTYLSHAMLGIENKYTSYLPTQGVNITICMFRQYRLHIHDFTGDINLFGDYGSYVSILSGIIYTYDSGKKQHVDKWIDLVDEPTPPYILHEKGDDFNSTLRRLLCIV